VLPGNRDPVCPEEGHDPERRTGGEPGGAGKEEPEVAGVETVDVLVGADGGNHLFCVNLRRQGELDEDPVDLRIFVEPADGGDHFPGRRVSGKVDPDGSDADPLAGPVLHPDIHFRSRIIADNHGRELGPESGFRNNVPQDLQPLFRTGFSIEDHESRKDGKNRPLTRDRAGTGMQVLRLFRARRGSLSRYGYP